MTDVYKLEIVKQYGIGGLKCSCCRPRQSKQEVRRTARRRLKQADKRLKEEECPDGMN